MVINRLRQLFDRGLVREREKVAGSFSVERRALEMTTCVAVHKSILVRSRPLREKDRFTGRNASTNIIILLPSIKFNHPNGPALKFHRPYPPRQQQLKYFASFTWKNGGKKLLLLLRTDWQRDQFFFSIKSSGSCTSQQQEKDSLPAERRLVLESWLFLLSVPLFLLVAAHESRSSNPVAR